MKFLGLITTSYSIGAARQASPCSFFRAGQAYFRPQAPTPRSYYFVAHMQMARAAALERCHTLAAATGDARMRILGTLLDSWALFAREPRK